MSGGSGEPSAAELAGPYFAHPSDVDPAGDHTVDSHGHDEGEHELHNAQPESSSQTSTGAWRGWNMVNMPSVHEQGDDSDVEIIGVPIMN